MEQPQSGDAGKLVQINRVGTTGRLMFCKNIDRQAHLVYLLIKDLMLIQTTF